MKTIVAAAFSFFYIAFPGSMQALPRQTSAQEKRIEPNKEDADALKSRPNIPTFRPKANLKIILMDLVPINGDER
jgi:hypothetical protein